MQNAVNKYGVVALMALLLAGCGAEWHPPQPGDTACLGTQVRDFHVAYYRAVDVCGTKLPDLTGDPELQAFSRAWEIPYQYNPRLDAAIKNHNWAQQVPTGSHIPDGLWDVVAAQIAP
ncbi:hypothetical protein [Rhizosaccharibacter radicis]|uniref:Uncharacterized protein n=1 Tax=Rhizosaccharibacter radicis TaxID=2782605 RepID=A0ABT1VWS2_9PROT|nr:hypothetical protein [Acetobacteraceae bacterium KSS12]